MKEIPGPDFQRLRIAHEGLDLPVGLIDIQSINSLEKQILKRSLIERIITCPMSTLAHSLLQMCQAKLGMIGHYVTAGDEDSSSVFLFDNLVTVGSGGTSHDYGIFFKLVDNGSTSPTYVAIDSLNYVNACLQAGIRLVYKYHSHRRLK